MKLYFNTDLKENENYLTEDGIYIAGFGNVTADQYNEALDGGDARSQSLSKAYEKELDRLGAIESLKSRDEVGYSSSDSSLIDEEIDKLFDSLDDEDEELASKSKENSALPEPKQPKTAKLSPAEIKDNTAKLKADSPKYNPDDIEEAETFAETEQDAPESPPLTPAYFYDLAKRGKYDDAARVEFMLFAEEATRQRIEPAKRGYIVFKQPEFDKYNHAKIYANDLRVQEMLWHAFKYPDHEADDEGLDIQGLTKPKCWGHHFDDDYDDDYDEEFDCDFDYDYAYKIAEAEYTDAKGKKGNLKDERKLKLLRIPTSHQKELVMLRSAEVKAESNKAKAEHHKELRRLDKIKVESITIREKLEQHSKKGTSRMKNIDVYANVWMALEITGGNKSNLVGIMGAYEKLSGEVINKQTLRDKIKHLEAALK